MYLRNEYRRLVSRRRVLRRDYGEAAGDGVEDDEDGDGGPRPVAIRGPGQGGQQEAQVQVPRHTY